ncbi:type VII secretion protein EssC [Sporosarcina jiandibaonis]|uniref:type VII secretion protein EssC n=1 Tax=Sporosarcina jiandibaonis TaxID=2715535 RepID=UPI0015558C92|nr:type VII secretion protein EssC [Sporosarcina jiandibaonis]
MAQHILMLNYKKELHKIQLPSGELKSATVGSNWSDTVTFLDIETQIPIKWDGESCLIGKELLKPDTQVTQNVSDHAMNFYLLEANDWAIYDVASTYSLTFGPNDYDEVKIENTTADFLFSRTHLEEAYELKVFSGQVYHNYSLVTGSVMLEPGDQLYVDGVLIKIGRDDIQFLADKNRVTTKLARLMEKANEFGEDYPDYHRSPRIIYREPEEKLVIANPSSKPSKPSEQLGRVIVPPLVMIAAMILVSFFRANGIYILVMLSMTVVTVIYSITSYVKSVKQYRIDTKERDVKYREYLKTKTKELYSASEEQRHALNYHYPEIEKIRDMALNVDARTYEKTMFHHDFLTYRVGLGQVDSSFELDFSEEEFTLDKDELVDAARDLRSQYLRLVDVPIVTDLVNGPVGYIGQRSLVLEQLQLLVMQTALFHSYHDLQFITIFPEEEKAEWDWMRWLPHASIQAINVRGFVYHERSRDQVLNSFYQILKERKQAIDDKGNKNEKMYFSPHYVVLITDEKMILDHIVMEFFNKDPSELGVSLVFVQEVMQSLPEHVKTVIDIRDAKNGNIILEQAELVNRNFTLDHFPKGFNKEDVSRALAPLNHLQSLKNSIPESVTFLEMYGVEKVEELGISARWAKNETYKSLAVPLGLRGKADIVNLNLHEKAHGPHGLVAGTTGSGKSEIIQSYIISLAVNFHPYEVGFLLIDYKGGGMANLFKDLPHLMGTITNLDGAQSMRALASIKAELQKRQRLFGEHDVNHINQYQKLFKQGEASEPMPHLFLISDEFAELKSEQPDFMKELVSTARIGRSLGIHLILATQKPSGVVDDQIWSNSKFKLALKVQDASDSNEILKTPDAAEITLPGRAYLQVGNNEIYELFQSAWSGADYIPEKEDQELVDSTVYAINDLGQYDILSEDLSGLGGKEEIQKIPTELDAVIDYVHQYTIQQGIEQLARPWLPPLPERIFAQDLHPVDFKKAWKEPKKALKATIGLLDQPELQAQNPLMLDLTKDGHMAVFSSPGYGKSTFLQTVVMDLAKQHNPAQLHVYLLDFGTNGLLPLKNLPHIADTIMIDEMVKIGKLIRILERILKERKQKLSEYGVANLDMYEKASGQSVPTIVIVLDNYDAVREADFVDEFERLITQIAREGGSVGVHLLISAGRQNAMRIPLLSNIKVQIPLYLIDPTEARSIVGRTELQIEEIAGRGLVNMEQPTVFQAVLPEAGEEALETIENIQKLAKEMDTHWKGDKPIRVPMMPEIIQFEEFKRNRTVQRLIDNNYLPLGYDYEDVEGLGFDLNKTDHLLVYSNQADRLIQFKKAFASGLDMIENKQVVFIDDSELSLTDYKDYADMYLADGSNINQFVSNIVNPPEGEEDNEGLDVVVVIADCRDFSNTLTLPDDEIEQILSKGRRRGIQFIIFGQHDYISNNYDDFPKSCRTTISSGVVLMKLTDQSILGNEYIRNEKEPEKDGAYLYSEGKHVRFKFASQFN